MKPHENYCWSCANKPKSRNTCYSQIRDLCPYGDGPPTLPSMWVERVEVVEDDTLSNLRSAVKPVADFVNEHKKEIREMCAKAAALDDDTELQAYDVAPHGYYNGHPIVYDAETDLYVADGVRCVHPGGFGATYESDTNTCPGCKYDTGGCDSPIDCLHPSEQDDVWGVPCAWTPKD